MDIPVRTVSVVGTSGWTSGWTSVRTVSEVRTVVGTSGWTSVSPRSMNKVSRVRVRTRIEIDVLIPVRVGLKVGR